MEVIFVPTFVFILNSHARIYFIEFFRKRGRREGERERGERET